MRRKPINETLALVLRSILEKKGEDTSILDLTQLGVITDYFVICHGRGNRQVQAIADNIEETLKRVSLRPRHIEGYTAAEWILIDYGDFLVHIFTQDRRKYYDLDKLWSDAPRLDLDPAAPSPDGELPEENISKRGVFF